MSLFSNGIFRSIFGGQLGEWEDQWVQWDDYSKKYGIPPGAAPDWALQFFEEMGAFSTYREFGPYGLSSRYWDPGLVWDQNMADVQAWLTPAPPAGGGNTEGGGGGGAGTKIGAAAGQVIGGPPGAAIGAAIGSLFG